jgi:hypothetical protein
MFTLKRFTGRLVAGHRNAWRQMVAIRDALSPNHVWRYTEDQMRYHYTHDKEIIDRAIKKARETLS